MRENYKMGIIFVKASVVTLILWVLPLILNKYPDQLFPFIDKNDILLKLVGYIDNGLNGLETCPLISPYVRGMDYAIHDSVEVKHLPPSDIIFAKELNIKPGGVWYPSSCTSRYKVVIILPYRDRKEHLNKFLSYIHPFLQRQQLFYRIVVVEQNNSRPFNRAKLFNIGYQETNSSDNARTCYIFHDLDLIPENDHNTYACTEEPRHMPTALDTFRYQLLYRDLLGGAVAILGYQFQQVDGFSNNFDGWGAEDDEFAKRLRNRGLHFVRFDPAIASYTMLPHAKQSPAKNRFEILKEMGKNTVKDGISSLRYSLFAIELLPLYTHILVSWD